ncbi:unnamed protein product [Phytophthora fragariaefolia]|uniref:Unnamed protein product n=1 Tax=Phytophthora fragariaefolia TaxID=1490495 RepID=A0A9W6U7Z3_9STRA|nr:unnamed protein product [Phytophthora fragariaefolia]
MRFSSPRMCDAEHTILYWNSASDKRRLYSCAVGGLLALLFAQVTEEYRAYLNGERDTDADSGANSETADDASTPASHPLASLRPRLIPAPPRGKNASYLANATHFMETRLAAEAADHTTASGKKKVSKRHEAASRREEKTAKEARAMGRANAAAVARSRAKEKHRASVAVEEERDSEARQGGLSQLEQNKAAASKAKAKCKAVVPSTKGKKKQMKTSPHVAEPGDEDDADDESAASSAEVVRYEILPMMSIQHELIGLCCMLRAGTLGNCRQVKHHTLTKLQQIPNDRLPDMNLKPGSDGEEAVDPSNTPEDSRWDHDALNSDVEGDANSDEWYIEVEIDVAEGTIESPVPSGSAADDIAEESDDALDGNALLQREKNRAKRQREKELLKEAKAKLSGDWEETTSIWGTLTKEEMEVLALDQVALKKMRADGWNFGTFTYYFHVSYPGLYNGEYGPTEEVLELAESPLQIISTSCHHDLGGGLLQKTKRHAKIQPEDIVNCIGLLVARMLSPHKRRFADHWATTPTGALPKGTFGSFVQKSRFDQIMQNLHFKVRSVVDTLQKTFASGFKVPPVLAFDEAMIPSRSRHNITRQFMKDKPHKWGTKVCMTCCANTAYCLR